MLQLKEDKKLQLIKNLNIISDQKLMAIVD